MLVNLRSFGGIPSKGGNYHETGCSNINEWLMLCHFQTNSSCTVVFDVHNELHEY